jgi:uncharacterized protein YndB with AHSA1/START domain
MGSSRRGGEDVRNETVSIHIDAPPETVFAFMLDPDAPDVPGGAKWRFPEGEPIGAGTQFTFTSRLFGRTYEGTGVIEEFVENQRVVFRFSDPTGSGTATWTVAPADGGSTVVVDSHLEMRIPVIGPILVRLTMPMYRLRTMPAIKKAIEKRVLAA